MSFADMDDFRPVSGSGIRRPNINSRGKNMSLITDIVTFGTAIGTVIFTLWMVKQVFTDKS